MTLCFVAWPGEPLDHLGREGRTTTNCGRPITSRAETTRSPHGRAVCLWCISEALRTRELVPLEAKGLLLRGGGPH